MTRLCAFMLTVGVSLLFLVVAVTAMIAVLHDPTLAPKIIAAVIGAIATVAGGMWAALSERK